MITTSYCKARASWNLHYKVGVILIDAVVAQVDAGVVQAALISRILHCGETDDSVSVQVNDERIVRSYSNVET